jgi:phosphate starvation-inducible PhoH-like protein
LKKLRKSSIFNNNDREKKQNLNNKTIRQINLEPYSADVRKITGIMDKNLSEIEKYFNVDVIFRDNSLKIIGQQEDVEKAEEGILNLFKASKNRENIDNQTLNYILSMTGKTLDKDYLENSNILCYTARGKAIKYKTAGQKKYVNAIRHNDITFAIGPAGTGKTYLAMAMAVEAFKKGDVARIVLTRPAVEAGESLGFLPGDLREKVDPYLRPLYDALYDIMGVEVYQKYMERGMIEVAPLAYMRGRTLDDSFIVLDEAQNTTPEQMKMFLTRLGFGSKAIVTGDITQVDLPNEKTSGLVKVQHILDNIKGLEFIYLTQQDVVRHNLVQKIIDAYDHYENTKK